jgi:hypothetical protein
MVVYDDTFFRVEQGWLSGWRISDKATGAKLLAPRDISTPLGFFWHKIRTDRSVPKPARDAAERWMFRQFAVACHDPSSEVASFFRTLSPDDFAARAFFEATRLAAEMAAMVWFMEASAIAHEVFRDHRFTLLEQPDGTFIANDDNLRRYAGSSPAETAFYRDFLRQASMRNYNSDDDRRHTVAAAHAMVARMITDRDVAVIVSGLGAITAADDLRAGRLNYLLR